MKRFLIIAFVLLIGCSGSDDGGDQTPAAIGTVPEITGVYLLASDDYTGDYNS